MMNHEITHDTVIKKAPPPPLPPFSKGKVSMPVIFLLCGAPDLKLVDNVVVWQMFDTAGMGEFVVKQK